MRLTRLKRVASGGAALALSAGVCAVIGLSAPAGAVNNQPSPNPTAPAVSYEADCVGSGAASGTTAPFAISTVIDTVKDPGPTGGPNKDTGNPTGTTFGIAGVVSAPIPGNFVASILAITPPASAPTVGLQAKRDLRLNHVDGPRDVQLRFANGNGSQPGTSGHWCHMERD